MTYFIYIIYKRISSNVYRTFAHSAIVHALPIESEALENLREHSNKVANDRPSPEIPHDSRAVSRAPGEFVT